jgi:phospholipid/cholesterol/gamma-HCH transport system permease protein
MRLSLLIDSVERVGKRTTDDVEYCGSLARQLWNSLRALGHTLPMVGNRYRWKAAVTQMLEIGVQAFPMVTLMAVCAGLILAMQGASELRRIGAIDLVVELVTIGFTRELGPLLTAIAVSGRSASAFSAEIGTMKVTEEIDAMRTMAIDPVEFVLAPKYLAALVVIPCLSIFSNAFGILAGGAFMKIATGMTFGVFLRSVARTLAMRDLMVGLLKSLAFATIIVQVGCLEGFSVRGGPDAVGRSTTAAVVKSTFLVILADVGFTTLFYLTGGV